MKTSNFLYIFLFWRNSSNHLLGNFRKSQRVFVRNLYMNFRRDAWSSSRKYSWRNLNKNSWSSRDLRSFRVSKKRSDTRPEMAQFYQLTMSASLELAFWLFWRRLDTKLWPPQINISTGWMLSASYIWSVEKIFETYAGLSM